jgi:hypothetical protein
MRNVQRHGGDAALRTHPWNHPSSKYLAGVADARVLYVIIGVVNINDEFDYCVTNCHGDAGWVYQTVRSETS